MTDERPWLVAMTKPKMEHQATLELRNQDYQVYLPLWSELKRKAEGWQRIETVMFPRYLFVRTAHAQHSVSPIRSTRGVQQLVRFGAQMAYAPQSVIDAIQSIEATRQRQTDPVKPFNKGDAVEVLDGPFKGVKGKVLSSNQERVSLLFTVFGKVQKVGFDSAVVAAT